MNMKKLVLPCLMGAALFSNVAMAESQKAQMNGQEIKDGVSIGDMGEIKVSGNTILSDKPVNLNIENTKKLVEVGL